HVTRARAAGPGKLVLLFGATTGRDGIGGASVLASQELGEGADEKRPSVQIGDPFTGKKLVEASVELVERGLVESLQDCGAAGLASALAEMARDGAAAAPTGADRRERVALAAGGAPRAPPLAEPRFEASGVRAVRPPRRLAHGAPPGPRRGGAAPAAEHARPRRLARRAGAGRAAR